MDRLGLFLLVAAAELSSVLGVLVVLGLRHRELLTRWRSGLRIGALLFFASLPASIFTMAHLDPTRLAGSDDPFTRFCLQLGAMLGLGLLACKIPWHGAAWSGAAAQWEAVSPGSFEGPLRGRARWKHRLLCGLFGMAAGIASVCIFALAGTTEGKGLERARQLFPGAAEAPLPLRLFVTMTSLVGIACAEEITFRGCLQGLFLQGAGRRSFPRALAVALASLLWTLLHVYNTTQPLLKCGQIFLLGLAFGELARRHGFDRAIWAHCGLNVAAGLQSFF